MESWAKTTSLTATMILVMRSARSTNPIAVTRGSAFVSALLTCSRQGNRRRVSWSETFGPLNSLLPERSTLGTAEELENDMNTLFALETAKTTIIGAL